MAAACWPVYVSVQSDYLAGPGVWYVCMFIWDCKAAAGLLLAIFFCWWWHSTAKGLDLMEFEYAMSGIL